MLIVSNSCNFLTNNKYLNLAAGAILFSKVHDYRHHRPFVLEGLAAAYAQATLRIELQHEKKIRCQFNEQHIVRIIPMSATIGGSPR